MSTDRHITWENFERDILRVGVPAIHPIAGSPAVQLAFTTSPPQISVRIPLAQALPIASSLYREIAVGMQSTPDGLMLAAWTTNASLFRPFFSVALEVADAVQLEGVAPREAVQVAVDRFASVVQRDSQMSLEQTVGLWGELAVLERLLIAEGPSALEAWTGWRRDQHDFRLANLELEVKATLSTEPVHVINGLEQLVPSEAHTLYIVSLQLMHSPEGKTLSDRVSAIRSLLLPSSSASAQFNECLDDLAVTERHLCASTECLLMRREPWLVPIDAAFPALTPARMAQLFVGGTFTRLRDVHYRVNVAGLGLTSANGLFGEIIPWMKNDDNGT